MKRVVVINADDWEAIYIDGKLHSEGHEHCNIEMLKLAEQFKFSSEDVFMCEVDHVDLEYVDEHGCFPKKASALKGQYDA